MGAMDTKWNHCDCKCIEGNGALEIYKFIKTKWFYKYQIYKYLMKHRHLLFLRRSWIYFSKKKYGLYKFPNNPT